MTLTLFATVTGQDNQDVRPMHDAIVRGWSAGPVGVLDELAWEGFTAKELYRTAELEGELEGTTKAMQEADARADELEREVDEADATIEALREEVAELRRQLGDSAA